MGLNGGPNLQDLFNQRFGANAYQSGVNAAYNAGRAAYNAQIQAQQQKLFQQQQAAQAKVQKPINDLKNASDYWNDPTNNTMLHQKGAWRVVQDLQNDPELQAQLKAQGYDPKAIADEAYNVATGGQIKSASGFKQFYKDVSPDSATQKQNEQEIQDQIDSDAANAAQAKIDAQNKANYNNSWYGKLLNGIGSGVSDVGKGIGSFANEALHNPGQAYQDLNTGAQRVGDQFLRGFGLGNLADYESQQNQALARAELKQNPNNAQAKAALAEDIGATSQAKTGGQKALNYLGGTIGTIAPYLLGDGALGALGKGGTAVTSGISNPIVQKMAQGALSGAVGSGISQGANLVTGGKTNPEDFLKELAASSAFGGGSEALLHGTVPLLKQLNLKGQAEKLMQGTGSAKYDPATFEQALKEANTPSGDVSNVVADQKPNMPQPFEQRYNLKPQAPTAQPTDVSNNNWFSSSVMQDHPMLNFTQQGANMPQARGILQDLSVPKAQTGTVNDIADQTLNRANTFSNAPTEGFNQRLLNAQQEMKGLQNNAQKIADQTGGTYNPDIESLYQQIRKPSDPKTFDDLVKAAEMENNVQNPSLKTMLKSDPKIKQAIDNLNALGKPSKQATNLIPEITPKNKGVTIPEVKGAGKTPQDILQDFKVNGGKNSGKGGADLIDQLKVTKGVKLNIGDVLNSLAEQRNYLLNSVKTDKNISKMSKEELTNVANKLEKQHELVSKAGNSKKLKAIEEDMAKVKQAGLKMDLQFFGAHAKANPIEAVREKLFGKVPDKTPQDIAREHAQVNSAVKQLDEKGKPVSEETVKTLQKTKDIMPNQTLTKNIYELADRLPKEIGDKIKSSLDAAKANHVNNLEERSNDLYNKVVQELGIKKGSKESALVQDYGEKTLGKKALEKQGIDPETVSKEELNKINDSELQKIAGNKTDAIKTADQYFRENYKNMIDEVNNTVREIYPNNPDKIVPERQDYYHHFNELDGFEGFKNLIQNSAAIDPHLAGISPNTKPNSKWQSFKQMRGNGAYKSDAVGGYLKYLQAASHSTHLDPMIKVLRNAADQIATATEGTKNLNNLKTALEVHADNIAGKTNPIDRLFQDHIIGRKAMKVLNVVNGHIKKNMILGNLGSALGQVGNVPLTLGKAKQYAPQGLIDTLKYTANHLLGGDKNISAPMNKSEFLKERFSSEYFTRFDNGLLKKPEKMAAWMLETADKSGTYFAWNSMYRKGLAKGVADPIKYADTETRHIIAGRGVGEVPIAQKAKITQLIAPFSLEVGNQWKVLGKQLKEKDFAGIITFLAASYGLNQVMNSVKGSPASLDPVGAVLEGYNQTDGTTTDKLKGAGANLLGETVGNIPGGAYIPQIMGLTNPTAKKDIFGNRSPDRFGTGVGVESTAFKPIVDAIGQNWGKALLDTLPLALPYGGNQVKKTVGGSIALSKGGSYDSKGKLQYPVDANNVSDLLHALLMGPTSTVNGQNYYNTSGKPLSSNQTAKYETAPNKQDYYNNLMHQRQVNAIKKKMTDTRNDKTLTLQEKQQNIMMLMQKLQNLQK